MMKSFKKILATVLVLSFSFLLCISAFAFPPSSNVIYQGIDVSNWQGNIDFSQIKSAGIEAVYIKASEGTDYVDSYFKQNYNNAKANNLKVGFYHFVTAKNTDEARAEADFFASTISGYQADMKLAMDFEEFTGLSNQEINEISLAFLERLQEVTGKEVIIYSDAYAARDILSEELTKYPIWVANYGVSEPENGKWSTWEGFQYSNTGRIAGIDGYVDLDKYTENIFLSDTSTISAPTKAPTTERYITVVEGDTLSSIAYKYNTTVSNLVRLNNISNPNLIYPGERIYINDTTQVNQKFIYTVKRGNTLSQIANQFGTTVSAIVADNNISNPNLIYPGERLVINTEKYQYHDVGHYLYSVQRGDNLTEIARKYDTTIQNIANLNGISNPNLIYPGEVLRIQR